MSDYIEREAALAMLHKDEFGTPDERWHPESEIAEAILRLPAADVVPVRHGRWIVIAEFPDCVYARCDQCKIQQVFYYNKPLTNYCPNCGALMDKDGDGETEAALKGQRNDA